LEKSTNIVAKAMKFASEKHKNQKRKDGVTLFYDQFQTKMF
jgi:(p)ppGpp synthase/HD superfamily hydrolase